MLYECHVKSRNPGTRNETALRDEKSSLLFSLRIQIICTRNYIKYNSHKMKNFNHLKPTGNSTSQLLNALRDCILLYSVTFLVRSSTNVVAIISLSTLIQGDGM